MRCASPPDSVAALRDRFRYSRPTASRKPEPVRAAPSRIWSATSASAHLRTGARVTHSRALLSTVMRPTSPSDRLPTVTDVADRRASSRSPLHKPGQVSRRMSGSSWSTHQSLDGRPMPLLDVAAEALPRDLHLPGRLAVVALATPTAWRKRRLRRRTGSASLDLLRERLPATSTSTSDPKASSHRVSTTPRK